jgi:hypothetical protein
MVSKIKSLILVPILLSGQLASAQFLPAKTAPQNTLRNQATPLTAVKQKLIPWTWQKNSCETCGIHFEIVGDINAVEDMEAKEKWVRRYAYINPPLLAVFKTSDADAKLRTEAFIKTLSNQKQNILKLYGSETTSQEYNLLASIAVGILGQESRFFANWRYLAKRNAQWAITEWKIVKAILKENKDGDDVKLSPLEAAKSIIRTKDAIIDKEDVLANSKGPTQIKDVPDRISQFYNMSEKDLWTPQYSAVATMGFLIEALQQLRRTARNNKMTDIINDNTIVDYLPYIYFGGTKKILNRTATPDKNIYVNHMKNFMKKVKISEVVE